MQRPHGDRFEALEPIHQGVREHFGGFDKGIAGGLKLQPRSWLCVHVRPLPETDRLPGHRVSRPASCVPRRAMAAPSDSSAPSRRISCGSDSLPRSKTCSNSRESTTRSELLERHDYQTPDQVRRSFQQELCLTIRQISVQKPRALQVLPYRVMRTLDGSTCSGDPPRSSASKWATLVEHRAQTAPEEAAFSGSVSK